MSTQSQDHTAKFSVAQTPKRVFDAVNNVRGWWSQDIKGHTDRLGAEWTYRYRNAHRCRIKVIEMIPDARVVWQVLDNFFNFTEDKTEWTGTKMIFDISPQGDKTELRFTHQGLVPTYECFDVCSDAWDTYINGSLKGLITTGRGRPNEKEAA